MLKHLIHRKMKILFCKDFLPPCGKKKNKKVGGVQYSG
jgi:hypothetical protein